MLYFISLMGIIIGFVMMFLGFGMSGYALKHSKMFENMGYIGFIIFIISVISFIGIMLYYLVVIW